MPQHSGVFRASSRRRTEQVLHGKVSDSLPSESETRDHWDMSSTTRSQCRYDHRLQALVQSIRDIGLAIQHGVPRSTARGWLTRTSTEVVTLDVLELDTVRLPAGTAKLQLLQAIERTRSQFSLRVVLRVIGLSHARYYAWTREDQCSLDDRTSCPRSSSRQLTPHEVNTIKEMVTSDEYRHVPTGILARIAQRLGRVFASPTT